MILFPAIDLKDGHCVRLLKGEMDQATVFNESPAAQALEFQDAGCEYLHMVDLNGAFAGEPVNGKAVEEVIKTIDIPIQLGGGVRDEATIEMWLDKGVTRVILGTVALRDPELVKAACKRWPERIAVGIDARDGMVAVEGWAETSEMSALDLALKFEDAGAAAIIHTDIDRDGVMQGPNLEASVALAEAISTPVIVSGGVASLDDLMRVKLAVQAGSGVIGAISGRAIYDGRIDLSTALAALAS